MLRILQRSLANLAFFKTRYAPPSSGPAPSGSSYIDKVISALGTLTSVVQNIDSKVQGIESKMHIVDSHSHSIAKLETQLGQLAIAVSKEKKENFLVTPSRTLKANNLNN